MWFNQQASLVWLRHHPTLSKVVKRGLFPSFANKYVTQLAYHIQVNIYPAVITLHRIIIIFKGAIYIFVFLFHNNLLTDRLTTKYQEEMDQWTVGYLEGQRKCNLVMTPSDSYNTVINYGAARTESNSKKRIIPTRHIIKHFWIVYSSRVSIV